MTASLPEDDQYFIARALERSEECESVRLVANGAELLEALRGTAAHEPPDVVLLDLNMPLMDGRAAMRAIARDPALRDIPVLLLVSSPAGGTIALSEAPGARGFVTKPVVARDVLEALGRIGV